jgi:ATP synthase F1 delta subunit
MFFVWFIVVQLVVAAIVVWALRSNLDNLLIEMAMKQFELRIRDKSTPISAVAVISHKALNAESQTKISKETLKNWGETVKPVFQIEKNLMGGVIIKVGNNVIDCSLRDRLHRAWTQR